MKLWHMQLEPSDDKLSYEKVKKIVLRNVIGMGKWKEKSSQQNDFQTKMEIGDVVLNKSGKKAIALVQVSSNYFEKSDDGIWFKRRRNVKILELLEEPRNDFPQPMGTLNIALDKKSPTYKYIDSWYKRCKGNLILVKKINLLKYQKQIILQGPPGTGKTRLAKILAVNLSDENNQLSEDADGKTIQEAFEKLENAKLIQFHPSYSYEDFVRGIMAKTTDKGIVYEVENKVLAQIAQEASKEQNKDKPYILIIDEINRANLSSVLGELIYALEYRDEAVESMYALNDNRKIILPSNLYIIGTMNTADRSVGNIDYAIRRRFTFIDVLPNGSISGIDDRFQKIKKLFVKDDGKRSEYLSVEFNPYDVMPGHSYFLGENKDEKFKYQVIPLLKEYVKDGVLDENALEEIEKLVKEEELEEELNVCRD